VTVDYPFGTFILAVVLSVLRFVTVDYPFGTFLLAVVLSVLRFTTVDYPLLNFPHYTLMISVNIKKVEWKNNIIC